jgi:hypothetical protein
VDIFACICH